MQLQVDEKGLIQAYALIGGLDGGQDYTGAEPADFETCFKPGYYKLIDGEITVNPDYQEPTSEPTGPTPQDLLNADMLKQVAANTVATAAIIKQLAAQVKEA